MSRDDMEAIWSSIAVPRYAGDITGRRAPGLPARRTAYLAVDGTGQRHVVVLVPDGTEPLAQRGTQGLEVRTDRLTVGSNPEGLYIDLACPDRYLQLDLQRIRGRPAHVACGVGGFRPGRCGQGPRPLAGVLRSQRSAGLSRDEALGLFGELWFLWRWLQARDIHILGRWMASPRSRHDFQWPAASVEVKTAVTAAAEGPTHRISSSDTATIMSPRVSCTCSVCRSWTTCLRPIRWWAW